MIGFLGPLLAVTFFLLSFSTTVLADNPVFHALGFLSDDHKYSKALDVSGDGMRVVGDGQTHANTKRAAYWQCFWWGSDQYVSNSYDLATLGADVWGSHANGISRDGKTIVGSSGKAVVVESEAVYWDNVDESGSFSGPHTLGFPGGSPFWGAAYDISADGTVIVGESGSNAIVWENHSGTVLSSSSTALAVSAGNNKIVGYTHEQGHKDQAVSWTKVIDWGSPQELGHLKDNGASRALGISANGETIVGWADSAKDGKGHEAFLYGGGLGPMQGLDFLPGASDSQANDVYYDPMKAELMVVGTSGDHAFIWDPNNGMLELQDVLVNDYHLDLGGWDLKEATAISDDGKTIVGWGEHDGHTEGWLAFLGTVHGYEFTCEYDVTPEGSYQDYYEGVFYTYDFYLPGDEITTFTDEYGNDGRYMAGNQLEEVGEDKLGQVYVSKYHDSQSNWDYIPVGQWEEDKGVMVGDDGLGKEYGYIVDKQNTPGPTEEGTKDVDTYRFGYYDGIFWEADVYFLYNFTCYYNEGRGDWYIGTVYDHHYYITDSYGEEPHEPPDFIDENGEHGYYTVTNRTFQPDASQEGQVFVDLYYDLESNNTYTPLHAGSVVGENYLGSERDYLLLNHYILNRFGIGPKGAEEVHYVADVTYAQDVYNRAREPFRTIRLNSLHRCYILRDNRHKKYFDDEDYL